jgi:hypothetical protein
VPEKRSKEDDGTGGPWQFVAPPLLPLLDPPPTEDNGGSAQARPDVATSSKKKEERQNSAYSGAANMTRKRPCRHRVPDSITAVQHERLEALGATKPPRLMIGKSLMASDVDPKQARLLFSSKRDSLSQVTRVFTQTEMGLVRDRAGLLVTAFDRDGRSYHLTCKYLESNSGYRFIAGWKAYVQDNGLGAAMRVDLWWFRSRKLHNRYELRDGKEKVPFTVDSGHLDGSLGLILLHYENDLPLPLPEPEPEPERAVEAPPVQDAETGHMESETTNTEEEVNAAIGLLMLSQNDDRWPRSMKRTRRTRK